MTVQRQRGRGFSLAAGIVAASAVCNGTVYHAAPGGDDSAAGTEQAPFATLQKAVELLKPGDTLLAAPGVYRQAVSIGKLHGAPDAPIVIRAKVPGASFLIGSTTLSGWRKTPDTRNTFHTTCATSVSLVYERDTNREYIEMADPYQVDDAAASFMMDAARGRIYVHASDDAPPARHLVEACVRPAAFDLRSGGPANWWISLRKHLVIEGFVICGYSRTGVDIMRADSCEVRNCVVHHCGAGIYMHSSIRSAIRDCEASWCYDRNDNEGGGIAFRGRDYDNVIENCVVHDIVKYGIRHYGGGMQGCEVRNCLAYRIGRCAIHTKGSLDKTRRQANMFTPPPSDRPIRVTHNVAVEKARPFTMLFDCWGMRHNTVGATQSCNHRRGEGEQPETHLAFDPAAAAGAGFADPAYHDFRLQADSPHLDKQTGAFPGRAPVFFVKPDGDDSAAGDSVAAAWADANAALGRLQPGQTLYILPGRYRVSAELRAGGPGAIRIRAHGKGAVTFDGGSGPGCALDIAGPAEVEISGVRFVGCRDAALVHDGAGALTVRACVFDGNGGAIRTRGACTVLKSVFSRNRGCALEGDVSTAPVQTYGCAFWRNGAAYDLSVAPLSDFNAFFGEPLLVGKRPAQAASLAEWRRLTGQDGESLHTDPGFRAPDAGDFRLRADSPCLGRGYLWSPVGVEETPHHWFAPTPELVFEEVGPGLLTPTAANLTWRTRGGKSTALVRFGARPDALEELVERVTGQHLGSSHAVTLFGLQPGATYHYQVGSAPYCVMYASNVAEPMSREAPVWDPEIRSFTTPATFAPRRRVLHVAKAHGSDRNDGLSAETAFASLHKASQVAEPGDRVVIHEGEYFGVLRPANSGLPEAPIVFEAAPGERVELSGKRLTQPRSVVIFDKRHITLRGFVFKEHCKMLQDDVGGGAQLMIGGSRDIRVEDCLFDGRMYYMASVWVFDSADVRFTDNVLYILSNYTGLILGMNTGRIEFDHNTFYTGATSLGHAQNNAELAFVNNIFGEKTRNKWGQPKFNLFGNRKLLFDHNYYAFAEANETRFALRLRSADAPEAPYVISARLNPGAPAADQTPADPLHAARELGLEEHGASGPLPWAKAAVIAEKGKTVRGVAPRDRDFGPLELLDFVLVDDASCRGTASDGGDPGRRF